MRVWCRTSHPAASQSGSPRRCSAGTSPDDCTRCSTWEAAWQPGRQTRPPRRGHRRPADDTACTADERRSMASRQTRHTNTSYRSVALRQTMEYCSVCSGATSMNHPYIYTWHTTNMYRHARLQPWRTVQRFTRLILNYTITTIHLSLSLTHKKY